MNSSKNKLAFKAGAKRTLGVKLTTEKKKFHLKNLYNIYINFINFFSVREKYFFSNGNLLMKLDELHKLNKFETSKTQLNKNKFENSNES